MSQEGQHNPTESHAINQELRQEGQAESMTQASTTLFKSDATGGNIQKFNAY